jgi:predicted Zn-dependent protease
MENSPAALVAKGPNNKMVRFDAAADYRSAPSLGQYITGTWAPSLGIQVMRVKTGMANGIPWARGFALVNTSRGGVLAHLVAYQFGPNEVYRLLSVTSSNVTAQEKAEFDDMVSSFRRLSPGEAAKLKPYRLKVVKVEKGETVYNLSKRMVFDDHRASRFRALNGLGPKDGLLAGQWVKIVVEE